MLQYFQLEHPENEMVLCDRPTCEGIADYLEVELDGTEHRLCAFHTMSDKYASRLPARSRSKDTLPPHPGHLNAAFRGRPLGPRSLFRGRGGLLVSGSGATLLLRL